METIKNDVKSFTPVDWMLIIGAASLFLPHVISVVLLSVICFIAFLKYDILKDIFAQKGKAVTYSFFLLEVIVSLVYKNWIGAGIMMSFFLLVIYIAFYREHISQKVFAYILDISLILSCVVCVHALFQFNQISVTNGYKFTDFHIFNSPKRRIYGTFQNANIFALMLEFMLAVCLYRFLQTKQFLLKVWYVVIALFQFSVLFLTGCRAALVPLIFVIPILLGMNGFKKLLGLYLVCIVALLVVVFNYPKLIPRFNDFSTIANRVKIWRTAIKGIKLYPLFGNGPWTYFHIYQRFHGHKAVFCHNIYLDCISCFGLVGTALFLGYVKTLIDHVRSVRKENRFFYSLVLSILAIVLIHGFVDGTINPLKTNVFLLMILSSDKMFLKK